MNQNNLKKYIKMKNNNIISSKDKKQNSEKIKIPFPIQEENYENNNIINPLDINHDLSPENQRILEALKPEISKSVKFDINNITTIPLKESYNLRYGSNTMTFNDLDDYVKDIIFDPKYANEKRSQSAYSKKSFREKFESMKLKVPTIKKWNCDPTAEVIIRNLEQKIDILTYENFILTKKIRELISNNKALKLNLSQNLLLIQNAKEFNDYNLKAVQNKNNNKNRKKESKNKEKDVELFKQINLLKDENDKLRRSNQNLAENNMELNKKINDLINENNLYQVKYEKEIQTNKNLERKLYEQNEKYNEFNKNNDNNSFNNNNSSFDMNKYLLNEEQYKKLLEENEQLHKKLRILLSIEDEDVNKFSSSTPDTVNKFNNKYLFYTPINENNIQFNSIYNSSLKNRKDKNIQSEDLISENNILKQKVKALNNELNKVTYENNQKLLKIEEKLKEKNSKNNENINKEEENNKENKDEELDQILNEILLTNINPNDEESNKMISTLKNIKNNDKKRISQCLIINNKLKSLAEENNILHSQLLSIKRGNNINNNLNSANNTSNICFCQKGNNESYDYLINALKIKDEIIIKYKERNDDNENKYKQLIIENSKLKENNKNNSINECHYIKKDIKINPMRREKADGLEDYLLDKLVNNQKQVLGERAPKFEENNYQIMSKSMQYQDSNDRMRNRPNNYHYRGTRINNY